MGRFKVMGKTCCHRRGAGRDSNMNLAQGLQMSRAGMTKSLTHLRCDVPLGLTDQTVLPVLLQQLLALRRLLDLHVLFLCRPYLFSNVL